MSSCRLLSEVRTHNRTAAGYRVIQQLQITRYACIYYFYGHRLRVTFVSWAFSMVNKRCVSHGYSIRCVPASRSQWSIYCRSHRQRVHGPTCVCVCVCIYVIRSCGPTHTRPPRFALVYNFLGHICYSQNQLLAYSVCSARSRTRLARPARRLVMYHLARLLRR